MLDGLWFFLVVTHLVLFFTSLMLVSPLDQKGGVVFVRSLKEGQLEVSETEKLQLRTKAWTVGIWCRCWFEMVMSSVEMLLSVSQFEVVQSEVPKRGHKVKCRGGTEVKNGWCGVGFGGLTAQHDNCSVATQKRRLHGHSKTTTGCVHRV